MSTPAQPDRGFKALTALRFFAIACIVFNHGSLFFTSWKDAHGPFNFSQAVSLFFILSGFVLTVNAKQLDCGQAICRFYISRWARIWPAHVFALLAIIALIPQVFKVTKSLQGAFIANLFLVHAWVPTPKFFFSFNSPSWSISALMFFYLMFPLILPLMKRHWYVVVALASTLLISLISLCNYLQLPEMDQSGLSIKWLLYVHPLCRIFEFICGMLAARFFKHFLAGKKLPYATLIECFLLLSIIFISSQSLGWRQAILPWATNAGSLWLHNVGFTLIPFTALILVLSTEEGLVAKFLKLPILLRAGEMTFSVFLLHMILIAYRTVNCPQAQSGFDITLYLATVSIGAYFLLVMIERPARNAILYLISGKFVPLHFLARKKELSAVKLPVS